jgi:hypothetical protein
MKKRLASRFFISVNQSGKGVILLKTVKIILVTILLFVYTNIAAALLLLKQAEKHAY